MTKLSSLASQLRSIQQADRSVGGISTANYSYVASFLFDEREAADIDNSAILSIAKNGLEELEAIDPGFSKFELVLFGENTLEMHRATLTKPQNEQIDISINSFLRLLSPYFLQKPAHKCLEWMIRKFHVHEMNLDILMTSILPYHDSVEFIRMVQIIYLQDNSRWSFLHDVKKEGRAISRSFVAKRIIADRSILDGVFECLEWMLVKHRDSNHRKPTTYLSFFTMLVLDYIQSLPKVELAQVLHLYPMVLRLAKLKKIPDALSASFITILGLAQRYPILSQESIGSFIELSAKSCPDALVPQLILTVARLVDVCYLSVPHIPTQAFNHLTCLPGFAEVSYEIIRNYQVPHFQEILAASFKAMDFELIKDQAPEA